MDSVRNLLKRIDVLLDKRGVFSSGIYTVGDDDGQFDQWYGSVLQLLEEFDGELFGGDCHQTFWEIWRYKDELMREGIDHDWHDEFWASFDLLHKVRSELSQRETFESFQPVLKNYIRTSSLRECSDDEIADLIKGLEDVCGAEHVSMVALAVHGRKVAEFCAERICDHFNHYPTSQRLGDCLNAIEKGGQVPRVIRSYLRLLQNCGNTEAHGSFSELVLVDGHAILAASIRMLEYVRSLP